MYPEMCRRAAMFVDGGLRSSERMLRRSSSRLGWATTLAARVSNSGTGARRLRRKRAIILHTALLVRAFEHRA